MPDNCGACSECSCCRDLSGPNSGNCNGSTNSKGGVLPFQIVNCGRGILKATGCGPKLMTWTPGDIASLIQAQISFAATCPGNTASGLIYYCANCAETYCQ